MYIKIKTQLFFKIREKVVYFLKVIFYSVFKLIIRRNKMKHFNTDIEALEVLANKHSRIKNRKDAELFLYKKYEPLMKK